MISSFSFFPVHDINTDKYWLFFHFQTRMQSLVPDSRAEYRNVFDALVRIFKTEGFRSAMRGVDATAYGAGPAHAVYFAMYEYLKKVLRNDNGSNHLVHGRCSTHFTD
jgi:solute carrier family 25 iron transporter 28/37